MDLGLAGRVALVTGGSRGLGWAIARQLRAEGATVVLCGRDAAAGTHARDQLGAGVHWATADVREDTAVADLIADILTRHHRLDVVVNNAGRFTGGDLMQLPTAAWHEGFDTKALGTLHTTRHARAALIASGQGRIVNISGITAELVVPGVAVTALANSALPTLTASLAQDLRAHGVTVNCVVPGYTLTEVWQDRIVAYAAEHGLAHEDAKTAILTDRGLGRDARWGSPDELARIVAFLASGPASYLSGATLRADAAQLPVTSHP